MSNSKLKYPFPGSEIINASFSMSFQDIFVATILEGKQNGSYLEIGAHAPIQHNNTFLLSKYFNWNGISIDYDLIFKEPWKHYRPDNKLIIEDALTIDYEKLLINNFNSNEIDYLQIDIEPSDNTLSCLKRIPLDKFKFKVITFETDLYQGGNGNLVREEQRNILNFFGYELLVGDVLYDIKKPYEDWWIHPELINSSTALTTASAIKENAKTTQIPSKLLLI